MQPSCLEYSLWGFLTPRLNSVTDTGLLRLFVSFGMNFGSLCLSWNYTLYLNYSIGMKTLIFHYYPFSICRICSDSSYWSFWPFLYFPFFLTSLTSLSILLIFSKAQLWVLLIFSSNFLFLVSPISIILYYSLLSITNFRLNLPLFFYLKVEAPWQKQKNYMRIMSTLSLSEYYFNNS